jgi:membrane protease YdiL (CAAX protease family)
MTINASSTRSRTKSSALAWRVVLGLVVLYAAVFAVRLVMGVVPNALMRWLGATPDIRAYLGSTLNYGVGIMSYIMFTARALQKVLHINAKSILFPLHKGWWQDILTGFLLVGAVLSVFFVFEVKTGWLRVDDWSWQTMPFDEFLRTAWVGLLINVGVAIGEETIFRGYLLTGLKTAWGKWRGLMGMMIVFGLFHLPAYMEGGMQSMTLMLAILLASLFGLMFGLVYLRSGSLWIPVSLHFAWNFIENDILNLTAASFHPNLIGAITQLQPPLTSENVIFLEMLMFGIIALGVWIWLKHRNIESQDFPV